MAYRDLREFIGRLEKEGELKRVRAEVDPVLEITEVVQRKAVECRAPEARSRRWAWGLLRFSFLAWGVFLAVDFEFLEEHEFDATARAQVRREPKKREEGANQIGSC